MKVTIVTPSIRKDFLSIVDRCLKRQTLKDYEWLVGSPEDYGFGTFVKEPPKRESDFYSLNKCWNNLFRQSKGELLVSIVDGLWFEPDLLEKLWAHYEANPKACISGVGNQYDQIINNKPEHLVWSDPRMRTDQTSFYQVSEREMELCVASIPRKAIYDVGGVKEKWDLYAALSEKEMCARIYKAGYTLWLDQNVVYRAISHPRIGGNEEWDKHYFEGCKYNEECMRDIANGVNLKGEL